MRCIHDRNDERTCAQYPDVVNVRKRKLSCVNCQKHYKQNKKWRRRGGHITAKNDSDDDTAPTSRTFLYTDITPRVFFI